MIGGCLSSRCTSHSKPRHQHQEAENLYLYRLKAAKTLQIGPAHLQPQERHHASPEHELLSHRCHDKVAERNQVCVSDWGAGLGSRTTPVPAQNAASQQPQARGSCRRRRPHAPQRLGVDQAVDQRAREECCREKQWPAGRSRQALCCEPECCTSALALCACNPKCFRMGEPACKLLCIGLPCSSCDMLPSRANAHWNLP